LETIGKTRRELTRFILKNRTICTTLLLLIISVGVIAETELTEEYQQDLIDRINYLNGDGPLPASMEGLTHPICGTPTAFEAFINYDRMSGIYKLNLTTDPREPGLPYSYGSPAGYFLLHYETSTDSTDAIFMPNLDTLNGGDGIPDYINKVAEIADSVWNFTVGHLGFPAPPSDGFYDSDPRFDIYILDMGASFYGASYNDAQVDSQTYTATIKLDNDYDIPPYNEYDGTNLDLNRRLDAARVTMAHEFFHAIHFAMDVTEWEGTSQNPRLYWWEMSATWMEEIIYDDINDYYGYLSSFFNAPWVGLRDFTTSTLYPYGAVVWPLYLTERWGDTSIVRKIWENCRDYGVGPHWTLATNDAIEEISSGTHGMVEAIGEFTVWNLFTGGRTSQAPAGIGYSEAEFYPAFIDANVFMEFDDYPIRITNLQMREEYSNFLPEIFGATYISLYNLSLVQDSFKVYFGPDTGLDWHFSTVGFPLDGVSEADVEFFPLDPPHGQLYDIDNYEDYLNLVTIAAPISFAMNDYTYKRTYAFGFFALDSNFNPVDTIYSFVAPYPNPLIISSFEDDYTFKVIRPLTVVDPGDFEVSIFNVAGEKIRHLTSTEEGINVIARWDMKNESGETVAPGVYLAYFRMFFSDGSPDVIKKYKLAVLK
jgi:hypothetical protein